MADTRPRPSFPNKKKLDFFKIMLGDFWKRLRIPDAFIQHFSDELSGRAVLEGPSGKCWLVKISFTKTGTYFKDGWETFQRDHSLTFAEILEFNYTGDMHFKVLIFGTNGCERHDTFVVEPSQGLTFGQGKISQSLRGDKGKIVSSPKPERHTNPEEATPYLTPQFMCKLAVSCVARPFSMNVPAKFAREYLPRETTMVRLQDKKGNTWKMELQVRPLQTVLCRGWRNFIEDNHLMVGDSCEFKLVRDTVMKVKIYRC